MIRIITVLMIISGLSGCAILLPEEDNITPSAYEGFAANKRNYDLIVPGQTTVSELAALGFDHKQTPNVIHLNYPEVIQIFMPNPSFRIEHTAPAIQRCLESLDRCYGLNINPKRNHSDRVGNAFLDIFGFRRETEITGWEFDALFVIIDNQIVYKLWHGTPNIYREELKKNPLGPLQNITPRIDVSN